MDQLSRKIIFLNIAQIGLKPISDAASRRELSESVFKVEKGALCAELRPFYCRIRILVPMSILSKLPSAKFRTWPGEGKFLRRGCLRLSAGVLRMRAPKGRVFWWKMEPRCSKMEPKWSKKEPKGRQKRSTWSQKGAKINQKRPTWSQKGAKGRPKCI